MSRVAAVVLAAGGSSRLGEPKQLAMLAGERLLERAVRVAGEAGCNPVVVVLGAQAERVARECDLAGVTVARNEAWKDGMASSVRTGVAVLPGDTEAVVLMTCDQPAVDAAHLRGLIALAGGGLAASSYAGRRGVPAVVPRSHFAQLLELGGDQGARELLRDAPALALAGGELDVDTAAELERARMLYG